MSWMNKNVAMLDNIIAEQEQLTQDTEVIDKYRKVRIYPFRIVSGVQTITKDGEVNILTNINQEGQYANFYTGNDQITIVWEGSTTLNANNPLQPNQIVENIKVGRYIDLLASEEGLLSKNNNLSTINLYGIDYSTTETQNTLSLFCDCSKDSFETNKVWSFLKNNQANSQYIASSYVPTDYDIQNYVYLILDPRYQSYQWLRIKNVVYNYNNATREAVSCLIEFETINNDFTNTGKSILQYFQHGTPNESYAFPKETYDENGDTITTLDTTKLQLENNNFEGITSLQIDYMGAYGLSSVGLLGRVVNPNNNFVSDGNNSYSRVVPTPQVLLLCKSLRIVESPFINRLPVQNVFAAYDMYNDVRGVYSSYKDAFGAQNQSLLGGYNITATKQIITGMRPKNKDWDSIKKTNALLTNGVDENTGYYANTNWFTDGMVNDFWITPINQASYADGVPNFIATSTGNNISIPQFLNINHIFNWGISELTTNYTQSTKYKLSDVLGVFGNIFTTITGGLDMGWITNKTLKTGQTYNILLPTEIIENQEAVGKLVKDNALPLDYFNDQGASKVLPVNSNFYTAYRFSLTHLFTYDAYAGNINTARKTYNDLGGGKNNIWNTKYLGQNVDENGEYLLLDRTKVTPNLYQVVPYESLNAYLLDWMCTKGIGMMDRRVSMYRSYYDSFLQHNNEKSVYQLIAQTKSKIKHNITLWSDEIKFNYYDQFNTFGHINWPVQDKPNAPSLDIDKNRQLSIPQQKMWSYQVNYADGSGGTASPTTYEIALQHSFTPLQSGSLNPNYSNATVTMFNQKLGNINDKATDWKTREQVFQNQFRIANFQQVQQNTTNDTLISSNWKQTYQIQDISLKYSQQEWAPNETLSNARTNLDSLDLNILINDTPNKKTNDTNDFTFTYTLTGDELANFLRANPISKDFTITFNKVPNSMIYPMSIFGDYVLPATGGAYYPQDSIVLNPVVTYGSWVWLTNLNRIFSDDILTYSLNDEHNFSRDYFEDFGDYQNAITLTPNTASWSYVQGSTDVSMWFYENNKWDNLNINVPSGLLSQSCGYDTINHLTDSGGLKIASENKRLVDGAIIMTGSKNLFMNYKPYCKDPTTEITLNLHLYLCINNDQSLDVKLTKINVTNDFNGTFENLNIKNAFKCRAYPQTSKVNGDYSVTPNLTPDIIQSSVSGFKEHNKLCPSSIFQAISNAPNEDKNNNINFLAGAQFMNYTEFNGNNWLIPHKRQHYSDLAPYPHTAISPSFYWNVTQEQLDNWSKLDGTTTGSKETNIQLVQEFIDAVTDDSKVESFINTQSNTTTITTKYPISAGGFRSGVRYGAISTYRDGNWLYSYGNDNTSLHFQYDLDLNFQPVLAFSFTPKWKN